MAVIKIVNGKFDVLESNGNFPEFRKKPSREHAFLSELDLRALSLSGLLGISGSYCL